MNLAYLIQHGSLGVANVKVPACLRRESGDNFAHLGTLKLDEFTLIFGPLFFRRLVFLVVFQACSKLLVALAKLAPAFNIFKRVIMEVKGMDGCKHDNIGQRHRIANCIRTHFQMCIKMSHILNNGLSKLESTRSKVNPVVHLSGLDSIASVEL